MSDIGLSRALAVAEEAAFLWLCRRHVVRSSAVTFDVLAQLDERLSRLVYRLSERPVLADPFLRHDPAAFKAGLPFVTAMVAVRGRVTDVIDRLLERLESEPALVSPLSSALLWLDYSEICAIVDRLLSATSFALLHLGLVTAVGHGVDPGRALGRALDTETPVLRATALEAAGRLAMKHLRPRVRAALDDQDATCRFWAAWSAVRLGDRDGISVLGRFAADSGPFARRACDIALRALDPDQAIRAQQRLESMAANGRLAVAAAGIIGDPSLANRLFEVMESPVSARRAGAAFSLMTGCDLRRDDLDADRPSATVAADAPSAAMSNKDLSDRKATPHPDGDEFEEESDDELAWPDPVRLRRWWDDRRSSFVPGVRYLAGLPIGSTEMAQVLRTGNQQQRAAAALELALLHPDATLLDVTAPSHRQLGAMPSLKARG